ncbi:uncharacterized protein LOC131281202 [Anopheles ziemanni]|uniref:uncharacterized protein LOC131262349 n=1 Tax=Anopheles coustani TaxID=139045 RepID=UPI00265A88A7|nr:uncharacterized protein LOC131262349 [Anopheles coustani]XP_058166445.1 uncharacterized protein LOC131281202 [Anopheles ziemanni]
MNMNERIINTQLFAQTIDETATTTTSIGSSVGLSVGFAPFVAATMAGLAGSTGGAPPPSTTVMLPIGSPPGRDLISSGPGALSASPSSGLTKQPGLSSPHHLHPLHSNNSFVLPGHSGTPVAQPSPPPTTSKAHTTAKSRSLSTGSYITKDSSANSSVERLTKSTSHTEVHVSHPTTSTTTTTNEPNAGGIMPQNKSLEEGRSMIPSAKASPPVRKPILRKSKKIVRTDSEFLKGNIYEKESSVSSSQYTPTRDRRREQFAEYRSSNPSSETHKSTDESSKNISTDEIDTVFSDTMDLEQMEQDYRMHLRNNLQREYKSDSDTLDEVGKKRAPDYNAWKNQSYENTFDMVFPAGSTEDAPANGKPQTGEHGTEQRVKGSTSSAPPMSSSASKADRPTDLELGSASDGAGGGKSSASSTTGDGPFGHLFEKNIGRFKRMNKLLKCKRFSTSALYEKKPGPPGPPEGSKPTFTSPTKSIPNATRSPVKSIHSQSKASISSSKSSLFGSKKSSGSGFTFKGKKFLFTGKSSPNKSKSNNEISYYRTKSTKSSKKGSLKNNSTACLNLETTCTSPLSEAFYNPTGSVRLSAMELYEKFCSQDFSGLYKHETVRTDTDSHGSGTDSSHNDSQRHLGAIRKYRRRNFKLLRQKSEPKFSFRTDTLYEDSYDGVCYHDEKDEEVEYVNEEYNQFLYEDEQYYEEDIEHYSIENIYYQRNGLMALPDGTFVQRYPYRMEDEEDEEEEEEEGEEGEEEEDEELGEEEEEEGDYQGEEEEEAEEEEIEENEFDEEDEDELEEQEAEAERRRLQRLQLPPPMELVSSMDSDCDEIYLMPQNESESKKMIIQDFLFHHSNNEFDNSVSGDDYDIAEVDEEIEQQQEERKEELLDRIGESGEDYEQEFHLERYALPDKETLTIYKICSKESILESMKGSTPERDALPHSASMEQYFLKSDCVTTLERTASLDLLSNSSGTLNKSTLTDYAFDTVRNMNLDSCSTSRLSLSLKSEIFEETANGSSGGGAPVVADSATAGPPLVAEANSDGPRIKSWNIEDFTLTPEESFSDEQLPLDEPSASGNGDIVRIAELLQERCEETLLSNDELGQDQQGGTNAQYTIVDLDEEPYLLDPAISEFTSEITKEFDLLFSRAETESLQAAASSAGSAADQPQSISPHAAPTEDPTQLGNVLKLLSDLPTRYSMQMLEHINLDADDICIPTKEDAGEGNGQVHPPSSVPAPPPTTGVSSQDRQPSSNPSTAHQNPPESAKPRTLEPSGSGRFVKVKLKGTRSTGAAKTASTTPTALTAPSVITDVAEPGAKGPASSSDLLKKARSQSLGNLRNKTKCFPL